MKARDIVMSEDHVNAVNDIVNTLQPVGEQRWRVGARQQNATPPLQQSQSRALDSLNRRHLAHEAAVSGTLTPPLLSSRQVLSPTPLL